MDIHRAESYPKRVAAIEDYPDNPYEKSESHRASEFDDSVTGNHNEVGRYLSNLSPSILKEFEKKIPELVTTLKLARALETKEFIKEKIPMRVKIEGFVKKGDLEFPLITVVMGSRDPKAPTLGLFGGVHGLERIGASVVNSWLQTFTETLEWDSYFSGRLLQSRLVFLPIVNPVGIYSTSRANGSGVDLMRNSPVRAEEKPAFLLGGQSYTNKIPWFSPPVNRFEDMEKEAQILCQVVEREMFQSQCAIAVDVHSGFGSTDQLWFPWAKTKTPPPHIEEIVALKQLFDRTYPNHFYKIEPQSKNYTTHGDLWDWLYERHLNLASEKVVMTSAKGAKGEHDPGIGQQFFIPYTLELGSWMWLKKNPRQIFSMLGAFNPVMPHRRRRILRRHITLFDFLHRAVISSENWLKTDSMTRERLRKRALDTWYSKAS